MYDFVAIDLENADNDQFACQIGIVAVQNGEIVIEHCYLIKPPGNRYGKIQSEIHGITSQHTFYSPEFDVVWEMVKPFFENQTLLMHNASADLSILNKTMFHYFITMPSFKVIDTCKEIGNFKLSVLAEAYDIDIIKHHDALYDARAVAQIWIKHLSGYKPKELIHEKSESRKQNFSDKKIDSSLLIQDLSLCNNDTNPVYNRKVVITGEFTYDRKVIATKLKSLGADIDTSITKNTSYVFTGHEPGPSKMAQVENLIKNGFDIIVLGQAELYSILNGQYTGRIAPEKQAKSISLTYKHLTGEKNKFVVDNEQINLFASKEFYVGENVKGNKLFLYQLIGFLGANHSTEIEKSVDLILIPDESIANLKAGKEDKTISFIEQTYNSSKSTVFSFKFIIEAEFMNYYKLRIQNIFHQDAAVLSMYNKYLDSVYKQNLNSII